VSTSGSQSFQVRTALSSFSPWRELATVSAIGMEMSWAILWYQLIAGSNLQAPYGQVFSILLILLLFTYAATRLGKALNLKIYLLRGVLVILLLISLLVSLKVILYGGQIMSLGELILRPIDEFSGSLEMIPAEFFMIMVVILIWWRGIAFAQKRVGPTTIMGGFRTGVFLFFAYGLMIPFIGDMPVLALYAFIFFSLLSLTSARISIVRYMRGGQQIPFNRGWIIGIILVILLMVSISALTVGIVDGEVLLFISNVFALILYIITIILAPFFWLFLRIAFFLGDLLPVEAFLELLLEAIDEVQSVLVGFIDSIGELFGAISLPSLENLLAFFTQLKPLALWVLILATVLAALATLRAALGRENRGSQMIQKSTIESGDLLDMLRRLLSTNLQDLSSRLGSLLRIRKAERLLAAERIRRIYRDMMDLTSQLGHPRPTSSTPLEFLPDLNDLFPQSSEELLTITNAYLRVRYGDLPESSKEVDTVEQAWQKIQFEGKDLVDAQ